jgi:hypothetical protein
MPKFFSLLALFVIVSIPCAGDAATFCLQIRGIPPQCEYADAAQCRKRANELQAVCVVNTAEITLPEGIGRFCVVDSSRTAQCLYNDRTSCETEATRANAVCIDNSPIGTQPDPHQSNPGRSY